MFKRLIVLLLTTFICITVSAETLQVRKNAPQRYVVKKGDTLWDLSGIYLDKPWLWPKLWGLNPQVKNPHLIYPGDVLSLTFNAQGEPKLTINRNIIKLSPKSRKTLKNTNAIPTLPLRTIRPYISYEQSLDEAFIDNLPYVMGSTGRSRKWMSGQVLYVSQALDINTIYAIYRKGEAYIDLDDGKPLGFATTLVATAKVIRTGDDKGEPAALKVLKSVTEITAGDKVLPANEGQRLPAFFKMTKPDGPFDATIIASPSKYREYSKHDIVVINAGHSKEAKVGNVLDIYHRSPSVVNDPENPKYLEDASRFERIKSTLFSQDGDLNGWATQMPKEKIGELMIFKVYKNLSYAFITSATKPIRVGDTTHTP